ncbi:nuclear valosin-containing protein-like [Teleopsis dalmanni]|uniref:nuclear valosin-containing protein-like n=1 Tax=Teleopsis dalmanni TaxID=139649 RepID=UPI0018CEA7A2|nr:nuclear valosin-containing protein-like [Teleopsis dalmanni]
MDQIFIDRVRKYLRDNVEKTYINPTIISKYLQDKFSEYSSVEVERLRISVKEAYRIISENFDLYDEFVKVGWNYSESDSALNNELYSKNSTQPAKKIKVDADFVANDADFVANDADFVANDADFGANDADSVANDTVFGANDAALKMKQKVRKYNKNVILDQSTQNFNTLCGMENTLKKLCETFLYLKTPKIYNTVGLDTPSGILLHGPRGCGKTHLAYAIAGEFHLNIIKLHGRELISDTLEETQTVISDVFDQALFCAPCVLFIDEIDGICGNSSKAQKVMERLVVLKLISCLTELNESENGHKVLVIAATSRPNELDPDLYQDGCFLVDIALPLPNRRNRKEMLSVICKSQTLKKNFDFNKIAELTPGYSGGDLSNLISCAATIAVKKKCSEQIRKLRERKQENITIVNLDNKENEETEKANKSEKEAKNSVEKTATEKEKETLKEEKNGIESKNTENKKTVDVEKTAMDKMKTNEEQAKEEKINAKTNIIKANDDDSEKKCIKKENIPELSLLEMRNLLINPSEEIMMPDKFYITHDDFLDAIKLIKPTAKREGFITIPDATWEDIGALHEIRDELNLAILAPLKFPENLETLGLSAPSGVLLCGPPGCGKTLLAKAIANEAGINFISVQGPELMNMYVGESERVVRASFQRARHSAPCVLFFDEFDLLCPKRSETNAVNGSRTRIVNQFLTEMDGVKDRQGVYIIAATNRPDIIDPAILRLGRLDTILYVGLPNESDRVEILKAITKNRTRPLLSEEVDFVEIAKKTDGFTGADLAGLMRQAAMLVLKQCLSTKLRGENMCVGNKHIEVALKMLRPSITEKDRKIYETWRFKYAAPRVPDLIETD